MTESKKLLINYSFYLSTPISKYHNDRADGSEVPLINDVLTVGTHQAVDTLSGTTLRNASYQVQLFVDKLHLEHTGLIFRKVSFNLDMQVVYEFDLKHPEQQIYIGIGFCDGNCFDFPVYDFNTTLSDLTEQELFKLRQQLAKGMDKRRERRHFNLYL